MIDHEWQESQMTKELPGKDLDEFELGGYLLDSDTAQLSTTPDGKERKVHG